MQQALAVLLLSFLSFSAYADTLAAGRAAMERREWEAAAKALEKVVAAEPKNAEAHYLLGGAYGRQAQAAGILGKASLAKKAKASLEKAVELDPNHINARQGLIDYYTIAPSMLGGSMEKALAQAAEIKKRDKLAGHRAYARIYARQEKPELARKELVDAVREDPNNARAHQSLGLFYLSDKNYATAAHEFEMARKLDPSFMPARLRLGQTLVLSGGDQARADREIRAYLAHKPSEDEPGLGHAWYWLGMLQEQQGRRGEAWHSYVKANKLMPEDKNIIDALMRVK